MSRILVIEDERHVRENLLDLLEMEGFEVIAAEDGQLGVQLAQEQAPDLILCDVMMPKLDGYDVLRILRQNPVTVKIPLILLTAKAARADLRKGMELGADDYLTKPFTREELLGAISTRLAKQAAITQPYVQALQQAIDQLDDYLHYDQITRLPTQLLLQERFNKIRAANEQQDAADNAQGLIPVISLGLDRFSRFSDLENLDGDAMLRMIAERLSTCIEQGTVARLNYAQFAIILTTIKLKQVIEQICQNILESLSQPFCLDGHEIFLTASLGVALYPTDAKELDDLMKQANTAMNYIQKRGGNRYQFYRTELRGTSSEQLSLEASLRHALERNEFQVFYQPQVDLQTGQVIGSEALVRWQHPERGMVSPAEFIPLAEETGLIRPIGEWVLHTACRQTQAWRMAGFSFLKIAVNLSGYQFSQPRLHEEVVRFLATVGLDPTALELELTESTLLQNETAAVSTLTELKASGVQIAIDDFGTGYASLSYLKQFPFDTVKIDQCFIRNVTTDGRNAAITKAVSQLSHSLNLQVVAEGVETESELSFLRQHHCDVIQGYLFSRPIPALEFEALLTQGKCLPSQVGSVYYSRQEQQT